MLEGLKSRNVRSAGEQMDMLSWRRKEHEGSRDGRKKPYDRRQTSGCHREGRNGGILLWPLVYIPFRSIWPGSRCYALVRTCHFYLSFFPFLFSRTVTFTLRLMSLCTIDRGFQRPLYLIFNESTVNLLTYAPKICERISFNEGKRRFSMVNRYSKITKVKVAEWIKQYVS